MTPAEAYCASLRAQHPDRHAPDGCKGQSSHRLSEDDGGFGWCRDCHYDSDGFKNVGGACPRCPRCDPRLDPDASLPTEVLAACDTAVVQERKACAALVDSRLTLAGSGLARESLVTAADAIRARGEGAP